MKLQEGMQVSTFNMNRETYNRVCKKFMTAGCPEGEYECFSNDEAPIWSGLAKRSGRHSNIFGMFKTIGWGPLGLLHSSPGLVTRRAVTVQDVLESV